MIAASVDGIVETFDRTLFERTPTKRVLWIGERCHPAAATQARLPVLAAVAISIATEEPELAATLVRNAAPLGEEPGLSARRFRDLLERELASESAVSDRLKLWVAAGIGDVRRMVKSWQPVRISAQTARTIFVLCLCSGSTLTLQRSMSDWLYGINDEWGRARASGLVLDDLPPFPTDGELRDACCSLVEELQFKQTELVQNTESESWAPRAALALRMLPDSSCRERISRVADARSIR